MVESSGNGGGGDEGVQPKEEVEALGPRIDNQTAVGVSSNAGVDIQSGGDSGDGHVEEVGAKRIGIHRWRRGVRRLALRQGARGKVPVEQPEFIPVVGSSGQEPISKSDFAKYVSDNVLAWLLEENPTVVATVLAAREERLRQIELAEEEEQLRRESEDLVREAEVAEKAHEEAAWSQELGMELTKTRLQAARTLFTIETYMSPEPQMFVPSRVDSNVPRWEDYDPELVLRDPMEHLAQSWEQRRVASLRGHGSPASSLELCKGLPERVRELVDATRFGLFIPTLTVAKSDHVVLTTLGERWQDTSNTFHFPIREMNVTPLDFVAITGLRVGGEPILFDFRIHKDKAALKWFLGLALERGEEMVRYEQFKEYLKKLPTTEQEEEQMARAYLLYLFGATLYPNKHAMVHLSYLPALRDLCMASRYDWGGVALGACYGFMGEFTWEKKPIAGYWKIWEVEWAPWNDIVPEPEYVARSRVVTWSQVLLELAFRWQWYLGDRRQHLARAFGEMAHQAVASKAMEAGLERQDQSSRSRDGGVHLRERLSYAAVIGLPQLSWTLAVRDVQGEAATI
ncbi:hypothetical protein RHMOL_Rhmol01G0185700 [Rhododendron molle]|uniref:Uncharacterized protein n=1 Tax=Rhododendron molle TaxID=49168 RepID=A0ACC0Q5Y3_RHOML|nr:hypothetical protein RHMOL_Rhmol01G0185700 [Rhododendron molle]